MKKLAYIFYCISLLSTIYSCTYDTDTEYRHYHIQFKNNTETTIWIDRSRYYPDTAIALYTRDPRVDKNSAVSPLENSTSALWSRSFYESAFGIKIYENGDTVGFDTLIVFVFNDDTLARYGWQTVRENYLVHQRYDLSLDDLRRLNWQLYFPPKESMRDIKMWPPYGTYDANGHRIEQ